MKKTKVFLTGATGLMGMAGLKELMRFPDKYEVTVLARDSNINRKKLYDFEKAGLKIVWGDLLNSDGLKHGIEDADIVLHVGGLVSPRADLFPKETLKVNIGSIKLIAGIVKEIEEKEKDREIKVVYIGSVSQYGSKLPPNHWGKTGDPLQAAKFDSYAVSKILGERELLEAGLKKWVSIRQTGILHAGLLNNATNPIAFHVPVNGVLEWITVEDSGRLIESVCRNEVPEEFWCNFYNAGGGEAFRLTNMEFERGILKGLGCPPPEKIFDPKWFASRNFHGMWFEDSDNLDDILHFREKDTYDAAIERLKKELPWYFKLTPLAPSKLIKIFLKQIAAKPGLGPLSWIKERNEEKIAAFWGSREEYDKIPGWKEMQTLDLERKAPERKTKLTRLENILIKTKCSEGHEYFTSKALERGGHGCPECLFIESKVQSIK